MRFESLIILVFFHVSLHAQVKTDSSNCKIQVFRIEEGLDCPDSVIYATFMVYEENEKNRFNGFDSLIIFKNLKAIEFYSNSDILIEFPVQLSEIQNLEYISANGVIKDSSFPYNFSQNKKLRGLELSGQILISEIPRRIIELEELEYLELSLNKKNLDKILHSILLNKDEFNLKKIRIYYSHRLPGKYRKQYFKKFKNSPYEIEIETKRKKYNNTGTNNN